MRNVKDSSIKRAFWFHHDYITQALKNWKTSHLMSRLVSNSVLNESFHVYKRLVIMLDLAVNDSIYFFKICIKCMMKIIKIVVVSEFM